MYLRIYRVKNLPAFLLVKVYCIQNSILVHRVVDATVGGARGGAAAEWVE